MIPIIASCTVLFKENIIDDGFQVIRRAVNNVNHDATLVKKSLV